MLNLQAGKVLDLTISLGDMCSVPATKCHQPTSVLDLQAGKELDLPVYFGDAGSPAVLHAVGAARAACAVITLDTPGANYRTVWALHKHFPNIRIYVRAHDVTHGITLEKVRSSS